MPARGRERVRTTSNDVPFALTEGRDALLIHVRQLPAAGRGRPAGGRARGRGLRGSRPAAQGPRAPRPEPTSARDRLRRSRWTTRPRAACSNEAVRVGASARSALASRRARSSRARRSSRSSARHASSARDLDGRSSRSVVRRTSTADERARVPRPDPACRARSSPRTPAVSADAEARYRALLDEAGSARRPIGRLVHNNLAMALAERGAYDEALSSRPTPRSRWRPACRASLGAVAPDAGVDRRPGRSAGGGPAGLRAVRAGVRGRRDAARRVLHGVRRRDDGSAAAAGGRRRGGACRRGARRGGRLPDGHGGPAAAGPHLAADRATSTRLGTSPTPRPTRHAASTGRAGATRLSSSASRPGCAPGRPGSPSCVAARRAAASLERAGHLHSAVEALPRRRTGRAATSTVRATPCPRSPVRTSSAGVGRCCVRRARPARRSAGGAGCALRPALAMAECRAGLRDLAVHRSSLPTIELRALASGHGAELGEIGLGIVLESGSPARTLAWMERTRAAALTARLPRSDDALRSAAPYVRAADASRHGRSVATAEIGDDAPARVPRSGPARSSPVADAAADAATVGLAALRAELDGRTLVELGTHEGRLVAVVVEPRRARVVELGAEDDVAGRAAAPAVRPAPAGQPARSGGRRRCPSERRPAHRPAALDARRAARCGCGRRARRRARRACCTVCRGRACTTGR